MMVDDRFDREEIAHPLAIVVPVRGPPRLERITYGELFQDKDVEGYMAGPSWGYIVQEDSPDELNEWAQRLGLAIKGDMFVYKSDLNTGGTIDAEAEDIDTLPGVFEEDMRSRQRFLDLFAPEQIIRF